MSLNAAALKLMADKGLSIQDVIEIASAMETRSAAAERQARYRQRRRNERDVTGDVTLPPNDNISNPLVPSEAKASTGTKRRKGALVVQVPEWVPAEPWLAYVAMRKSLRNVAFTDNSAKLIINDLDKLRTAGHDPGLVLMKAVKHGWRGVFGSDDTLARGGSSEPFDIETYRRRQAEIDAKLGRASDGFATGPPKAAAN